MNAEQQQGRTPLGAGDTGGTRGTASAQQQTFTAWDQQRALTDQLMEQVCDPKNFVRAYRRVRANKGKPGVDGMTVRELADWLRHNYAALAASLLDGTYQPLPVRGVQIPKPGGGQRQLGIPVAVDRLVQQAILQVLNPILDPTFSNSSYGFRPGRDQFLEGKLRLRVNREKSAVAPVGERKFLGHRLLLNGKLGIAPKSIKRAQEKIRQITRRNRGVSLAQVIVELNLFLVGWITYYRYAACRFELQCLDEWTRRKLR